MKKMNKELEQKIESRETEVQRAYDAALEQIRWLNNRKEELKIEMKNIEKRIDKEWENIELCRQRCRDQGFNPYDVL